MTTTARPLYHGPVGALPLAKVYGVLKQAASIPFRPTKSHENPSILKQISCNLGIPRIPQFARASIQENKFGLNFGIPFMPFKTKDQEHGGHPAASGGIYTLVEHACPANTPTSNTHGSTWAHRNPY